MNILLTGATGFIGRAVMRLLLDRGHDVLALSRSTSLPQESERGHWLSASLEAVPWEKIEPFAPEVLVHAAWVSTPGVYLDSPENAELQRQSKMLFETAYERGIPKIVALGTCIEYALDKRTPLKESDACAPKSPYACAKHELHQELAALAGRHEANYVWGRVFYPYGVGEHPKRLGSSIIRSLRARESVNIRTPESVKDYIYIDDLASAIVCCIEQRCHGAYNLGSGEGVRVVDMVNEMVKHVNFSDTLQIAQSIEDPFPYVVADNARLEALGWSAKVGMAEGIRRLAASL